MDRPGLSRLSEDRLSRRTIVLIVAVSAAIRILAAISSGSPLAGDATLYDHAASSFSRSGSLLQPSDPVAFNCERFLDANFPAEDPLHIFPVGFPAFLGAIYAATSGEDLGRPAAMVILALLNGVIPPLLALDLFRQFGARSRTAELSLLCAVGLWPEGVLLGRHLLSENLSSLLLTTWLWLACSLVTGRIGPKAPGLCMLGLSGGALFLTRAEFAAIVPIVTAFVVAMIPPEPNRSRGSRASDRTRVALLAMAPLSLCLLLPTVRNAYHFGGFLPTTLSGGKTLWLTTFHSDTFYFSGKNQHILLENYVPYRPELTDENFRRLAVRLIRENPAHYALGALKRLLAVNLSAFGEPAIGGRSPIYLLARALLKLAKISMLVGFFAGILGAWPRQRALACMILFIYSSKFLAIHVFLNGVPRMFCPFAPIGLAVAALGYLELARRFNAYRSRIDDRFPGDAADRCSAWTRAGHVSQPSPF